MNIKIILVALIIVAIAIGAFFLSRNAAKQTSIFGKSESLGQNEARTTYAKELLTVFGSPDGKNPIDTKAKGISACKNLDNNDCFAVVAVAFNDMGVCKNSSDKVECEASVQGFVRSFEDRGAFEFKGENEGNAGDDGDTDDGDSEATVTEEWWGKCIKEQTYDNIGVGKMRILGKENITIKDTTVETCCYEAIPYTDEYIENAVKTCVTTNKNQVEEGSAVFEQKEGKYVPIMATLKIDGKQCVYNYDENGNLDTDYCE
ncbi:hypothetical protein GYA27_02905 [candidate division WWE3 bacterium]|uniref:Uncharacterized protein n=1 Tax=candidate division WWE3 bacterium TaxID=2053526 RepID=A0A7X9DKK7_UNCKA|nr:hypothetical protein [candidate division WWE3 bacterium]